jgi:hypothetical protein
MVGESRTQEMKMRNGQKFIQKNKKGRGNLEN